jgi:hypothetical protein
MIASNEAISLYISSKYTLHQNVYYTKHQLDQLQYEVAVGSQQLEVTVGSQQLEVAVGSQQLEVAVESQRLEVAVESQRLKFKSGISTPVISTASIRRR